MLDAVVADEGRSSIAAIARAQDIPVATAHRQVATLASEGYLSVGAAGRYFPGSRLLALLHKVDEKQVLATVAAPFLDALAASLQTVVQLGTFEHDMVTYRLKAGSGASALFTQVGMQLEAYCSGMGKVLLAYLPDSVRNGYLATGPFPALTPNTITDPAALRTVLQQVGAVGHAFDRGEILTGLNCVAVPVRRPTGEVIAALSATFTSEQRAEDALPLLRDTANAIERTAFA